MRELVVQTNDGEDFIQCGDADLKNDSDGDPWWPDCFDYVDYGEEFIPSVMSNLF